MAPEWFNFKPCLAAIKGYERLTTLFTIVLGVNNAGYNEFLFNLKYIKDGKAYLSSADEQVNIARLYKALHELYKASAEHKSALCIKYVLWHDTRLEL